MAEEDTISFHRLSDTSQLNVIRSLLNRDDPEIEEIITGMKALLDEECKKTMTVRVDGVLTEVIIYVIVGGHKQKVSTIHYNSF